MTIGHVQLRKLFSDYGLKILVEVTAKMNEVYHWQPTLTPEQQARALQKVESAFSGSATAAANASSYLSFQILKDFSALFTDAATKEKATRRATEMLTGTEIYQGYLYATTAGVNPVFTPEQFASVNENYRNHSNRFRSYERADFQEKLKLWNPEGGQK